MTKSLQPMTLFALFASALVVVFTLNSLSNRSDQKNDDLKVDIFSAESSENNEKNGDNLQNNSVLNPEDLFTGSKENSKDSSANSSMFPENFSPESLFENDNSSLPASAQNQPQGDLNSSNLNNTSSAPVTASNFNPADLFSSNESTPANNTDNINTSSQNNSTSVPSPTPQTNSNPTSTPSTSTQNVFNGPLSRITLPLLQKAGFKNITLQKEEYDKLFHYFPLKDSISLEVMMQNLLEGKTKVATFYEFVVKSHFLADEVYALLKAKMSGKLNVSVHETNELGEKSFYVNFLEFPKTAFLVVKKGDGVYAFSYGKDYHPFIQKLIQLLP